MPSISSNKLTVSSSLDQAMKVKLFLSIFLLCLSTISGEESRCLIKRCGDGYFLNIDDCVCELKNTSCTPCATSSFTLNQETCKCSCDIQCNDGFNTIGELDDEQCICVQKPCSINCPKGFRIDYENCANICRNCGCVQDNFELNLQKLLEEETLRNDKESSMNSSTNCDPCQNNFTQDTESCECYCDLQCFDTFDTIATLDFDNCSCLYTKCNYTCPNGFVFDGGHCKNVCHDCRCIPDPLLDAIITNASCIGFDYDCAEGFWYNPESCQCQIRCDEGLSFVNDECLQTCGAFVECDDDSKWNQTACSCVCSPNGDCRSGQLFNQENCQCESINVSL